MSTGKMKFGIKEFVIIVVCAAVYAATLISTGTIKIGPGTWLRPGNALMPVFGTLFGIYGCIGLGIGNWIADAFLGLIGATLGIPGVIGNFLGGFIPYLMVRDPGLKTRKGVIIYVISGAIIAGVVVAVSIGLMVYAWGIWPWEFAKAFIILVTINQIAPCMILSPILQKILYPYVIRAGLYRGREPAVK